MGVARREQHPERGPRRHDLLGEFAPVHAAGHHDVREQQIERRAVGRNRKRIGRIGGGDHLVAEALQLNRDVVADVAVVLDAEDGLRPAHDFALVIACGAKRAGLGLRQIDRERRAAAFFGFDLDAAAGLLDEAEHHAEPETRALADLLGREERIEDAFEDRLRNPRAGIGDLDLDIVAGIAGADRDGFADAEHHIARRQRQPAPIRHRVAGVDREVEQRRGELPAVGEGQPDVAVELPHDLDLLVEGRQQQLCELFEQGVDVDLGRLQRLLARKGEQARGQGGAAVGRLADQLGDGRKRRVVLHGVGEDLDRARDHGEHVVEFVRDAAGELADRLHLLRLDQLLLGGALLRHVLDEIVDEGAAAEAERRARRLDQDLVAVPVQQACLETDADRRVRQFRQEPHHALPESSAERLGDEQIDDVGAKRLLPRPSGQGLGLKAPLQHNSGFVGLDEGIERGLDQGLRHLRAVGVRPRLLGQLRGDALVL